MIYQKPTLEKFGTFRDLTRLGIDRANDGVGIFGTVGCSSQWNGQTYEYGCPADATAS